MSAKCFIDTNIFIYTFDRVDERKRKKSLALVGEALQDATGFISYQVIQEFVNTATRKFSVPMTAHDVGLYLKTVLLPLCQIESSAGLFASALAIHEETRFSFYDALIVAGAVEGGCRVLYSEDLQHGRVISGVRIVNPFI